ncbi:MAG TPA: hypothetical protein VGG90_11815 [Candidatus Dormibacteraeota bacterium]
MPEPFSAHSRISDVVARLGERGRDLLRQHGYEVGEGFTDVLSQYQSLEHAARADRLRGLEGLVTELNSAG